MQVLNGYTHWCSASFEWLHTLGAVLLLRLAHVLGARPSSDPLHPLKCGGAPLEHQLGTAALSVFEGQSEQPFLVQQRETTLTVTASRRQEDCPASQLHACSRATTGLTHMHIYQHTRGETRTLWAHTFTHVSTLTCAHTRSRTETPSLYRQHGFHCAFPFSSSLCACRSRQPPCRPTCPPPR